MTKEEAIKSFDEENGIKKYIASLNKNHPSYKDYLEIIERNEMAISALKGGWIPVSEENLPEDFQEVLVTVVRYNGTRAVRAAEYHENPSLSRKTFRILENNERWEVGEEGLIAWMPKPEPYKGESEVKPNEMSVSEER